MARVGLGRLLACAVLLAACRRSPLKHGPDGGGSSGASGEGGADAASGSGGAGTSPDASADGGGTGAHAGAGGVTGTAGGGAPSDGGGGGRDAASSIDAPDAAPPTGPSGFPDAPFMPASCKVGGKGLDDCGGAESCCTSPRLGGGTFSRQYVNTGAGPTGASSPATVDAFRLDKYAVTVGRFRQFVRAWNNGAGWTPPAGSGKHIHLAGGLGLSNSRPGAAGTYETGWSTADNANLAPTNANLDCAAPFSTWTPQAGTHENLPMTCVTALEAQAFCIWDGGFLPSEAEWIYAAAGGAELREYPWGSTDPGSANKYAIYGGRAPDPMSNLAACHYPNGALSLCTGVANIAPVGTATLGAGRWGQLDLAGNMSQWMLDSWDALPNPYPFSPTACVNCASFATKPMLTVSHGGRFDSEATGLLPTARSLSFVVQAREGGFRCARPPCEGGRCVCHAGDGTTMCDGLCVDEQTDVRNCGACGNVCPAGISCKNGSCLCPGGKLACGGVCVDVQADHDNCGACGKTCGRNESCQGARCVACPGSQSACDNVCTDLENDAANCGMCGQTCPAGVACGGGGCERASCQGLPQTCGPFDQDCCVANHMEGGKYDRSNDVTFPATVSPFFLDDYEITVGRFRRFVAAELAGWRPPAGAGKHTHLNGGLGLNQGTEPGWNAAWSANLATTATSWKANLQSCGAAATWTDAAAENESKPVDCLSWYEAYAFCIWDGGFLPTEAEWNWSAAGGDLQRVYPWSDPATSTAIDCTRANFAGCPTAAGPINPDADMVSSNGAGAFEGYALAGNVAEWVLDAKGNYPIPCDDCANLSGPGGIVRGGDYTSAAADLKTSVRASPTATRVRFGARCARPF